MCNECFSDDKLKTKTTFTVECEERIIVIKNVPCLECRSCGEVSFVDEVSAKLENFVNVSKKLNQEISVIDYIKVV